MVYRGKYLKNISFPLGGLGTGSVGLAGNGELVDWEIFNRPNKNSRNGFTHFAVRAKWERKTAAKVLQGDTQESLIGPHRDGDYCGFGFGPVSDSLAAFPHFEKVSFRGEFPMAELTFTDAGFPASVKLTAFNPFIPQNDADSSLPAAFFEIQVKNAAAARAEFTLAFSARNTAERGYDLPFAKEGVRGIFFRSEKPETDKSYTDLCIATDESEAFCTPYWYRGGWSDPQTVYWRDFCEREEQPDRRYDEAGCGDHGSLFVRFSLAPGCCKKVRFLLCWNTPNNYNYWDPCKDADGQDVIWKNYYATRFENSEATAEYCLKNFARLSAQTRLFRRTLFRSSMPAAAIDAVSANLSTLKTAVVLRLEDGAFYGWEGAMEKKGCCEGTCQHVWNYAYALPFLFPSLERSLRETVWKYNLDKDGKTEFRTHLPRWRERKVHFRACVDGQMGEVIKAYREWKICGDDAWLCAHWKSIRSMLDYACSDKNPDRWDPEGSGICSGRQHHTLDMELFGPNSWLEGMYLLALQCGAEMAARAGEEGAAARYRSMYERGRKWTNENLFNGSYFVQKIDLHDKSVVERFGAGAYWNDEAQEIKYQYAEGCEIDQMLADWHAAVLGRERIFDGEKKKTALMSLYRNNFKPSMRGYANMWRVFCVNDEAGAVMCDYPAGVRKPVIPLPYCEETMTGFEYALAGLMIAEGLVEEGESIVRAVRARYRGDNRNPWSEIECGSNYARAMASFALLPLYSGFSFDLSAGRIGFSPLKGEGRFLWSVGTSWGEAEIGKRDCILHIYGDPISLASFSLPAGRSPEKAFADGRALEFEFRKGALHFEERPIRRRLRITFSA